MGPGPGLVTFPSFVASFFLHQGGALDKFFENFARRLVFQFFPVDQKKTITEIETPARQVGKLLGSSFLACWS